MIETSSPRKTLGAGLGAGMSLAGVVLAGVFPVAGLLTLAVAGLPALLIGITWGVGWFAFYGLVLLGAALGLLGPMTSALVFALLLVPTAVVVVALRQGLTPMAALAGALVIGTVLSTAMWWLAPLAGPSGVALWRSADQIETMWDTMAAQFLGNMRGQVDENGLQVARERMTQTREMLSLLIPVTFIFVWHLFSLGITYMLGQGIAARLQVTVPPLPLFRDWQFDWRLVWMFLIGWALFHGADYLNVYGAGAMARRIGANCLAMSQMLYLIAGFSLIAFFFHKYAIGPGGRLGITFLALMLAQVVIWLGIIDVWAEFRAPRKPAGEADAKAETSFFDDW